MDQPNSSVDYCMEQVVVVPRIMFTVMAVGAE